MVCQRSHLSAAVIVSLLRTLFVTNVTTAEPGPPPPVTAPAALVAAEQEGSLALLPLSNVWKFRGDPEDKGVEKKWHEAQTDASEWAEVRSDTGNGYESQGFNEVRGFLWYRQTIRVPKDFCERKQVVALFGAADQQAWIYINGKFAHSYTLENSGVAILFVWRAPFIFDVKPFLKPGEDNVIAVRIYNTQGMGGLWQPCFLYSFDLNADLKDLYQFAASKSLIEPLETRPYGYSWARLDLKWYESPLKEDPAKYATQFLEVLKAGMHLLGDTLHKSRGMLGDYYLLKIKELESDLRLARGDAQKHAEKLARAEAALEALERDLVIESVRALPAMALSWRRIYEFKVGRIARGKPEEEKARIVKQCAATLRNEVMEQITDWERSCEGLARKGINLDLSVEKERILKETPDTFAGEVPDRLYEQKSEFYRSISNERQRIAAELVRSEMKLEVWRNTVSLRRSLGAKLADIEPLVAGVGEALKAFRKAVTTQGYSAQAAAEQAAQSAMQKLQAVLTAEDGGAPVIWPGASLYSSGRLALGPAWQGLLNSEINHNGFFRSYKGITIDEEDRNREWSFSYNPPGVREFEMEETDGSWTHRTRRYYYPKKRKPKQGVQEVIWSILAPGTLVNTLGPVMALSDTTLDNPVAPHRVVAVLKGKPALLSRGDPVNPADLTENWLLLINENGIPQFPVLVVFENRPDELAWTDEALEVRRAKEVGRCVVALAYGAAAQQIDGTKGWKEVPPKVLAQVRKVVPLLTYYPITTEEVFAVEEGHVRVWSRVTKALELKSDFCTPGKPYVPLPTLYGLSLHADLGLKVDSPLSEWVMLTKYGPYQVTHEPILSYRLRRARMWDRLDLRPVDAEQEWLEVLNKRILVSGRGAGGRDFGRYNSIAMAAPGYLMATPENREMMHVFRNEHELDSVMGLQENLPMYAYIDPATLQINMLIDPVTSQYYWVRGWRRNRYETRMRGDVPNRQTHPITGAYCYARFFGAWDILERNWEAYRRAYSAIMARQDWAVPAHSCMSTGFVFATDMLGDAWRSHHLMNCVASTFGHVEEQSMAQYLGSIALLSTATLGHPVAVPYVARVTSYSAEDKAAMCYVRDVKIALFGTGPRKHGGAHDNLYSFAGCTGLDYPIYDGLFTAYPATGHYQHQVFGRNPLMLTDEYIGAKWSMIGLTNYMKYLSWAGLDKKENAEKWEKLLAHPNVERGASSLYRLTILNALPFFIAQGNHLYLAYWDTARLEDGTYHRGKRLAEMSLTASRPGLLRAVCSLPPQEVRINGKTLPPQGYSYDARSQELRIPFGVGHQEIAIQLGTSTTPKQMPGMLDWPNKPKPLPIADKAPLPGRLTLATLGGDVRVGKTASVLLVEQINMGWADAKAGDGKGGTTDEGQSWALPRGSETIRGVPFRFLDPEVNADKSCIVLKGKGKPLLPEKAAGIKVGKRIRRVFFLHAAASLGEAQQEVLKYVLHFKSGQTRELSIVAGKQIGDWKLAPGQPIGEDQVVRLPDLPGARGSQAWPPAPADKAGTWGRGVGGYVYSWTNDVLDTVGGGVAEFQKGLDILESIDIVSAGNAVPMVFGITVELAE